MASDDFQPRLFFLDHSSILTIKRWMPQYRDKWDNLDVEFNNSFSLEDVETLKEALRVFGDESKVLFVFRPFPDLTYNHGYLLISDRTVEGKLKLIHRATNSYNFGIFPYFDVRITEEKLAPSMGSSYFIGARQMCQLLMNVAPWSPILTETCETAQKGEREWNLTAIYGAETRELTPLPQLFQNKGWNFQHFGYCSTLEPIEDGFQNIQPFVRRNGRTLRIKLGNGYSVQLFSLVNLNFLNQFRRLSPSVENVSEMATNSNFAEEESWETGPIPIPRKIKQFWQEQFTLSAQLQMSSALKGKSTRAIIPQFQNAEVPPPIQPGLIPQRDIPSTSVSAHPENTIELPTSAVVSEKKNPKEISSKNFSISFEVGGGTMTVDRKGKDNLTEEFVQNVLQSLENGYQSSESKTEVPLRNQKTEKTGFDQQPDEIQLLTDQTAQKITTISQIGEKQSGKELTNLAQYKNNLTPNLTKPETESKNAATATKENAEKTLKIKENPTAQRVGSAQQENAAKTLEIQDSTIKVSTTALKEDAVSTLKVQEKLAAAKKSRKPTTVYKIITLEDFQIMKASQAINKSLVERLKSNPPKFLSIGKKKEQVFENRNSKKSADKLQSSQNISEVKKEMDVDRSDNLPEKLVSVPVQTPNPTHYKTGGVNCDLQKSPGSMSPQALQQQMHQQPLIETNQATLALHANVIPPNIPPASVFSTSPFPADHQGFGQQSPVYPTSAAHQPQQQQQKSNIPTSNSSSKSSTMNGNGGICNNVSPGACTSSKSHQLTRGINNTPHAQKQVQPQMSQSIPPPPQKTNLNKDDQGGCGYSELRPSATTASASDEELDYEKYCRDMALAQRQLQQQKQSSAAPAKSSGSSSESKSLKSSCSSTPVQNNKNLMPAGSPNPNPKDNNDDAPGAQGIREEREVAAPKLRRSDRIAKLGTETKPSSKAKDHLTKKAKEMSRKRRIEDEGLRPFGSTTLFPAKRIKTSFGSDISPPTNSGGEVICRINEAVLRIKPEPEIRPEPEMRNEFEEFNSLKSVGFYFFMKEEDDDLDSDSD